MSFRVSSASHFCSQTHRSHFKTKQIHTHVLTGIVRYFLSVQVVSSLPDDIRPGPDLYGVPWEPVIVSGLVGLVTLLLFTCRCYSSVSVQLCIFTSICSCCSNIGHTYQTISPSLTTCSLVSVYFLTDEKQNVPK